MMNMKKTPKINQDIISTIFCKHTHVPTYCIYLYFLIFFRNDLHKKSRKSLLLVGQNDLFMDFLESILILSSENYQPGKIFIILF